MKYIIIDQRADGDQFETICDNAEEANRKAEQQWNYLTAREKETRHIFAAVLPDDSAYLDPDNDNTDTDSFPGCFDSYNI